MRPQIKSSWDSAMVVPSVARNLPAVSVRSIVIVFCALLAHERPDYVIVAVPWPVTPVATRELVALGVPVLAETPPAPEAAASKTSMLGRLSASLTTR